MNFLPDQGGKSQGVTDDALTIKTSPTIWPYEVFRLEWDRRSILREMEIMLKSDTRIKRANHVFASTAVRKGITVTVTSQAGEKIASEAQDVINNLMRDCQINSKLNSWARVLLKDGDLFLNPIIDLESKTIKNIKRLPAITMQRLEDMTGNFEDNKKAFKQIDPISLQTLSELPLWAVNHIRWDHEEGELYGNSQYLACRGYWRKLNMTEEDLVVRRRTRAPLRRFHSIGNKENPSDWTEVEKYKEENKLGGKAAQITTDYFGNGLVDVKNLEGDGKLDEIEDVEHLQEVYIIGTGVPLHIMGFGKSVNRDIVDSQMDQFRDDTQELRSLLEYGDASPYSGIRFIFNFALALAGLNPLLVDYSIRWFENEDQNSQKRVKFVTDLRSSTNLAEPLISKRLALEIVSRDLGLENARAIDAELERNQKEIEEFDAKQNAKNNVKPNPDNGNEPIEDDVKKNNIFSLYTDPRWQKSKSG